jgi:hypothetical protein
MRLITIIATGFSFISPATARSIAQRIEDRPSMRLAQADPERERRLQQQREAERALQEAERLRREIRNNGFRDGNLEQRTNEQIIKIRESGADPQRVREAQTEINRLREENRRNPVYNYYPYYGDFRYPYLAPPIVPYDRNFNDPYTTPSTLPPYNRDFRDPYTTPSVLPDERRINEAAPLPPRISQTASRQNTTKFSVSAGFKDGKIAPAFGARWNNFGVEVGAIFNADSLPGALNDFALPNNFLFNDLGVKKISTQYGGDILGYFDLNPSVSLYGGVGIYFQTRARIAQSQATNELYTQTNEQDVTPAVSAGVDYNISDSINIGVGYHSLRGVTGKIGFSF